MNERTTPRDAASHVVTCPLVVARVGPDGHQEHLYRGARIPAATQHDQLRHLIAMKLIAPIGEPH